MNTLVSKEDIFKYKLNGNPIVVLLLLPEERAKFPATRQLFFETGIYKKIEPDDHSRNCEVTHDIHFVISRGNEAEVAVISRGHRWYNEVWDSDKSPYYLP